MTSGGKLIGRERELGLLSDELRQPGLVTVTGPGGCGKSSLAVEVAGPHASKNLLPSVLVELGSARTQTEMLDGVLHELGGHERPGRSTLDVVLGCLDSRAMVLVLDNCEQVADSVGRLVTSMVRGAPELRVLVTSRVPLGIPGEVVFRLEPLTLPATQDVPGVVLSDAGRLFVERACSVDPGFVLGPSSARAVARVCHRLDGLPLAIGLAAAQVKTMPVTDIALQLPQHVDDTTIGPDDRPPQHQSIRASIDWSYGLLNRAEQDLLDNLSVFSDGWGLRAACDVAQPEADESEVRIRLDALTEKSLIIRVASLEGERWSFLQTVKDYAAERLSTSGTRTEIETRHMSWYTGFAARADKRLIDTRGHDVIDEERGNLRFALKAALDRDLSSALALVASMTRHWILTERFQEANDSISAVLAATGEMTHAPARAVVHSGAAVLGMLNEDYEAAVEHLSESRALLPQVTDDQTLARCLMLTGIVLILTGSDLEEGIRSTEGAVELLRALDDPFGLAWALANLEFAAGICDRFETALKAYDEFCSIEGATGHRRLRVWAEQAMAWSEVVVGSPLKALKHVDIALELEDDQTSTTYFQGVCHRIHALARLGRLEEATAEARRTSAEARESEARHAAPGIDLGRAIVALMQDDIELAAELAEALIAQMPQPHTTALMREVLARVALIRGDSERARSQARELAELAGRTGSSRQEAIAQFVVGRADLLDGDLQQGLVHLREALAVFVGLGVSRSVADVLDELALLAASAEAPTRCARLAGAATAARRRVSCAPFPDTTCRLETAKRQILQQGKVQEWEKGWAEGAAMSLADAANYARRARGPRRHPIAGWESLSPIETEVSELAASGLSNPEIAAKLYISRGTVKMHLSSIYVKLQLGNRIELARALAVRAGSEDRRSD